MDVTIKCFAATCLVAVLSVSSVTNAALVSRLGGAAAYDDVLDITWLTDAALSGTNNWDNQIAWIASLNTANHLGFSDWRLASMSVAAGLPTGTTASVINCSIDTELACRDNELGYMYFHNIGVTTNDNLTGTHAVGDVTLTDVQSRYWSGTEKDSSNAWNFWYIGGGQNPNSKIANLIYGWAVHAGDVSAVPVPAAVWLFGSGLIGLIGIAKRKKA